MSSTKKWKGKYAIIDIKNPSALGVCDLSGFVFNRNKLYKQMEWRGNNLVWTGMYRAKMFLDEPNQQNKIPVQKVDPKAIKDARPPTPYTPSDTNPISSYNEMVRKLNNVRWNE